jgi:hypothetical protein
MTKTKYIGLDVHQASISIAVLDEAAESRCSRSPPRGSPADFGIRVASAQNKETPRRSAGVSRWLRPN